MSCTSSTEYAQGKVQPAYLQAEDKKALHFPALSHRNFTDEKLCQVCMRLGVTVLRQHLLEESSDVVELSEAFGQSEALTTRLKHIIGLSPILSSGTVHIFKLQQDKETVPAWPLSLT